MDDDRARHQRKGCMLVLSRRKNESILIDGVIRVEVVTVTKAAVRVRLMAPRSLHLPRGIDRGDESGRDESDAVSVPVGLDVSHLTLVNQQIIALGEFISLGVVDADKARAVFFVDAPTGMSVTALKTQEPDSRNLASRQNLLQFMGLPAERASEDRGQTAPAAGTGQGGPSTDERGPELIPFPRQRPGDSGCDRLVPVIESVPGCHQTWSTFTLRRSRSLRAWCQIRSITALGWSTPGQVMNRQLLFA